MLFLKDIKIKIAFPFLLILSSLTCAFAGDAILFTVLHTNDHHGAYWQDSKGQGGLVNRLALIENIRKETENKGGFVLLLDAGDVNTGTPESDLMMAEPDFKGMAKLGYDAMTLGNHEFDNPLSTLKRQQLWAGFPFLSANIYMKGSDKRVFSPYQLFERKGLKIGVFGLTTIQTKTVGSKKILADLDFRSHTSEAQKAIAEMRAENPDIIIGLTHLGYYPDGHYGSNAPGDITLARELMPGSVDMLIGGHSHTAVCMQANKLSVTWKEDKVCQPDRQNGTLIFQALESGKYLGRADFTWQDGKLTLNSYQLLPVEEVMEPSPAVKAVSTWLGSYKSQSDKQLLSPLASLNEPYIGNRDEVRNHQTNMGRLIIEAQMDKTGADFGIISSGSIRSSIDAGIVSYRDILKVQPFGNTVTYVDMTGQEVMDYLQVILTKTPGSGAYAQYHNISFEIKDNKVSNLKIKGVGVNPLKAYRMSLPSYNANGGDGYPEINKLSSYVNTGYIDAEVLKSYISTHYPFKNDKV